MESYIHYIMESKNMIISWKTAAQNKYSILDCNFFFWVKRDCSWQSGIRQPQNNLKTSTPPESTNVFLGKNQGVPTLPVILGLGKSMLIKRKKCVKMPSGLL